MKKKLMIGLLSGTILLGGATFASAANENGEGLVNFGQMKPYIEEMHPDLSVREQKEMFESCHGEGNSTQMNNTNMMNNF